ncbi:MAG: DUF6398 domain-containing protein [Candidatus Tectomicrobia bacterium]
MAKVTHSEKVPKAMQATFERIVNITDHVAQQHLNDEYAQLVRYATAALCRKRPSPVSRGKPETWACGITHAIGMVNFLFDSSQTPHMKASALYKAFEVSQGSGQGKSKSVRDILDMYQFDPNWCLPSRIGENPMVWMIMVDGMAVDARQAPREVQELAYEQGIIPYIPGDPDGREAEPRRQKVGKRARKQTQCGLCGRTGNLTKTECCGQRICDDAHTYRLFSYARNSCYRNHDRYTLCSFHYQKGMREVGKIATPVKMSSTPKFTSTMAPMNTTLK